MQNREIKTVMHQVKTRTLQIKKITDITSSLRRITLTGEELSGFTSLSPDDHIKVFFPYPGEDRPVLPVFGPNGPQSPDGRRPIMRDYTPRRYDEIAQELDIEFFLHGEGPGSSWAQQAQVGQSLTIGGPRGSKIVPYNFDGYLMIGDESALPSFARRLEELPLHAKTVIVMEVETPSDEIAFISSTHLDVHWLHRNGHKPGSAERFIQALQKINLPQGDFFAWIASEKNCAKQIENFLLAEKKTQSEWIKATGYWSHS
ncbi:MAG: siderophore-interacting protein [Bdellovibrio sp.]